ncbi:MAG: NADPH-dependent glutamate synthase [Verrucomicrobia bacterium]|nr:NADPH-dependent glutamate synthase [Verrucomicrobiota bacterium]
MSKRITTKQRMQISRQKMPAQNSGARAANFEEVNLGFTEHLALLEADRCLQCKDPRCVQGCPVSVNIPKFLDLLTHGKIAEAAQSLMCDNALPSVTGRVCPQETQCEAQCVRAAKGLPVGIGHLERYVADWAQAHRDQLPQAKPAPTGKRVVIVGGGPAGLTAAGELARQGHDVTIYEALHKPGGVLVYGIPEFRLPKKIVQQEVDRLLEAGVKIRCNVIVGRTYTLPELRKKFDAVFVANGAGLPVFMNVPGENLKGVYSANEYLTRINLMAAYQFPHAGTPVLRGQRVAVIGGGNVAMDAVRTARRLGAEEAMIVYRRTHAELPARAEEVHHAEEEGIRFEFLTAPVAVVGSEKRWVTGLKCVRMKLGQQDASGRARPEPVAGSEFVLPCDVVVVAIGTRANPLLTSTCPDLKLNKYGNILADSNHMTNLPGVFAGGDIVRGAATVILAMGDGKRAAQAIDAYLKAGGAGDLKSHLGSTASDSHKAVAV